LNIIESRSNWWSESGVPVGTAAMLQLFPQGD
jgi:hypothetical protein